MLVVCVLLPLPAAGAVAEGPPGPRLALMLGNESGFQLISADPAGGDQQLIVGGAGVGQVLPFLFSRPSWSADGTNIVFTGLFRSKDKALLDIYSAAADGSGVVKLPGTRDSLDPVLSADGHTLAFAREREREVRRHHQRKVIFRSAATWLLDLESGAVRQLTPWRNGFSAFPSSFSPDGSTLAITRERRTADGTSRLAAVALRLDGSGSTVLTGNASGPVYSPDGTRVAMVTVGKQRTIQSEGGTTTFSPTELAVAAADGSGLTKLTHTRNLELMPDWDPSGERLAYTLFRAGGSESDFFGIGDSIMEINANGTCKTKVLSVPGASLYGAIWQPGPGREAGPIAC